MRPGSSRALLDHGPVVLLGIFLVTKLVVLTRVMALPDFPEERAIVTATTACVLAAGCWLPLVKPLTRYALAIALNLAVTILAHGDLIHFRFFRDPVSFSDLWRLSEIDQALASIRAEWSPWHVLLYLDVVLALLALPLVRRLTSRDPGRRHPRAAVASITAAALLALPALAMIRADREEVFAYTYTRRQVVSAIGVLPYHLYDLGLALAFPARGRLVVGERELEDVTRFLERDREAALRPSPLFGVAKGCNLVVILAESLQSFPIGLRVDGREVTPNLNRFASESLDFERFFDQTHLGTTSDAEFAVLQSLHPIETAAVATRYPTNTFHALPHVLEARGYSTLSAIGQEGEHWNMYRMHPRLGFQRSVFADEFPPDERFGLGLPDDVFLRHAARLIAERDEPFMALLLTLSSHHPYELPEHYRTFDPGRYETTLSGRYLQAVHVLDSAFGLFIDELRARGLLDRTVIAVVGDHHGYLDDPPELAEMLDFDAGDPHAWWNVRSRLPFLVRLPDGRAAGRRMATGGHLDVAPTLLSLLGVSPGSMVALGRDLTAGGSLVVFRDGTFADDRMECFTHIPGTTDLDCRDALTGEPVRLDSAVRHEAQTSRRRLEVSDEIIAGNLIPSLVERVQPQAAASSLVKTPLVVGHRGSPFDAPENTLESIRRAFDRGADLVEMDVRLSRDGVPFLMHDDTLDRTTNGHGPARLSTIAEIRALRARSAESPGSGSIPTLVQAAAEARGRGRLLLDLKEDGLGAAIARAITSAEFPESSVVIGAWSSDQARDAIAHMPRAMVLHTATVSLQWDRTQFRRLRAMGVDGVEVWADEHLPPGFVEDAHAAGLLVYTYTVNEPYVMQRHMDLGVDAIETDQPGVLGALRDARGRSGSSTR